MSASGPAFGALYTSDQLPHKGRTDIGLASARGDLEEVERSVRHGHAPSWAQGDTGRTKICVCLLAVNASHALCLPPKSPLMAPRLIEAGTSPSAPDEYLETPLHLACCFGHLNVVKVGMGTKDCLVGTLVFALDYGLA